MAGQQDRDEQRPRHEALEAGTGREQGLTVDSEPTKEYQRVPPEPARPTRLLAAAALHSAHSTVRTVRSSCLC